METRDKVVDFVDYWKQRAGTPNKTLFAWIGLHPERYREWKSKYNQSVKNNHNQPKSSWLTPKEQEAIKTYARQHEGTGYRRLSYMMLDEDVVCASPGAVYRVLKQADLLGKRSGGDSKKGKGFVQPTKAHSQWHTDISYVNIEGTYFYLISVLDGYSRAILSWDIRHSMTETDVALVLQRAVEAYPDAKPRLISDNGKQYCANELRSFVRHCGMQHTFISPYYPQSNGKIERWHKSLKEECIRPQSPINFADGKRIVSQYITLYNEQRLHSALGYITPMDKLNGKEQAVFDARNERLSTARENRANYWTKVA